MPTYEYQCPHGHTFERFQKMTDRPRAKCPVCGKPATRKISGGAGLVFKGSGFYITDYGKDGKGPRKPEVEERPAAEAKPDSGTQTEAAKPESKASPPKSDAPPPKSSPRHGKGKAASE
jgi:putative FmdB family regulatory protein